MRVVELAEVVVLGASILAGVGVVVEVVVEVVVVEVVVEVEVGVVAVVEVEVVAVAPARLSEMIHRTTLMGLGSYNHWLRLANAIHHRKRRQLLPILLKVVSEIEIRDIFNMILIF